MLRQVSGSGVDCFFWANGVRVGRLSARLHQNGMKRNRGKFDFDNEMKRNYRERETEVVRS
jgi:hypothetical protein